MPRLPGEIISLQNTIFHFEFIFNTFDINMADRKGSKPRDAYTKRPSNLAAADDGRQPFKKTRTDNSFKPNRNAEQSTVRLSK